ncbi:unnamed protein product [Diplocarpon coronariae]
MEGAGFLSHRQMISPQRRTIPSNLSKQNAYSERAAFVLRSVSPLARARARKVLYIPSSRPGERTSSLMATMDSGGMNFSRGYSHGARGRLCTDDPLCINMIVSWVIQQEMFVKRIWATGGVYGFRMPYGSGLKTLLESSEAKVQGQSSARWEYSVGLGLDGVYPALGYAPLRDREGTVATRGGIAEEAPFQPALATRLLPG